jgi:hypothetical protein
MTEFEFAMPIPIELRQILEEVYLPEGAEVWWRSKHDRFGGRTAADWFDIAPDEVLAAAEALLGQTAT